MSNNWYIEHNGKTVGPVTSAKLKQLAVASKITRSTKLRLGETGEWVHAEKVNGLFAQTATDPMPAVEATEYTPTATPPNIPKPPEVPAPLPSPNPVARPASTTIAATRKIELPFWAIVALPALLSLVVGYFIGRAHLQYQIRSTLTNAFAAGLGNPPTSTLPSATNASADQSTTQEPPASETPQPPAVSKQLAIGETHNADLFSLTLTEARIEKAELKNPLRGTMVSNDPCLLLYFDVKNTDERRILRFREGNRFLPSHFMVHDDVDNVIRGVDFGSTSTPVGAVGDDDIEPGASAKHVEIFSVPPPKTEFLILKVNLECFGGEGTIEYRIPASEIKR